MDFLCNLPGNQLALWLFSSHCINLEEERYGFLYMYQAHTEHCLALFGFRFVIVFLFVRERFFGQRWQQT